jgi:hypothetical protein
MSNSIQSGKFECKTHFSDFNASTNDGSKTGPVGGKANVRLDTSGDGHVNLQETTTITAPDSPSTRAQSQLTSLVAGNQTAAKAVEYAYNDDTTKTIGIKTEKAVMLDVIPDKSAIGTTANKNSLPADVTGTFGAKN